MYPLFESIKIRDGNIFHFEAHFHRMQDSARSLWNREINLSTLKQDIEDKDLHGLQKCKVFYNQDQYCIECLPYKRKEIQHLFLIEDPTINYPHKYTNRDSFTRHLERFKANDDIIITQNNYLTDSSYSNIALWNGREWHTPKHPLFNGIKRSIYIAEGIIIPKEIKVSDLGKYENISLINVMLDLNETAIHIRNVIP